ncbi:MAG TPA: hypothetical protein ENG50_03205 [Candidatus Altiarchaeales archaeon]|nr:hypothetical protein [Candidatus Altiarchaeales archaeon]
MSKRLSELYGMEIFTEKAEHVGRVEEIILNLEKGEVMQLVLRPLRSKSLSGTEIRRILQEESIPFSDVVRVGDIVIVKKSPRLERRKLPE